MGNVTVGMLRAKVKEYMDKTTNSCDMQELMAQMPQMMHIHDFVCASDACGLADDIVVWRDGNETG